MMRNPEVFARWEAEWIRRQPVDYRANLRLLDGLVEEARLLGAWPPRDIREGLQDKIRFALELNVQRTAQAAGERNGVRR